MLIVQKTKKKFYSNFGKQKLSNFLNLLFVLLYQQNKQSFFYFVLTLMVTLIEQRF